MRKITIHFLLAAFAGFIAINTHAEIIVLNASQQKNMGVAVAKVLRGDAGQSKRFSAEVLIPPAQERLVSVPQQGLIEAMLVATGETVKKGQVLARISSPDLVILQRDYLQANIQEQLAQKAIARDEALFKEGIIPERRYFETKSQYASAHAQLAQTKQSLRLAGVSDASIAKMNSATGMQTSVTMVAPIAGQVVEQLASVGQRVDSAMPIYRIAQLNKLWLELSVPIEDVANIQVGSAFLVPAKQLQGKPVSGKVVAILRSVNKQNQTTKVRVEISQGSGALSPGELVEAEVQNTLETQTGKIVFKIPKTALARNGQQVTVFKQVATGFSPIAVTLISEQGEFALVQGALSTKDAVVVKGIIALKGAAIGMGGE